ncbi:hypothetical protein EDC01DRAFT_535085 [Geopyxis carbonaria]|nr:hypothetical protein EDC01DRAFT_535085 [Geopyxis carbonaria]
MSWKRTESFFDQDNSSKKNPGFYRKQKSETESSSAPKSSNTKAPLPVSASTKEKLSQFAFKKPATPSKSHHASENHTTDGPITARISQDQQNLPTPSKSNQRDSTDSDIHHQPKPPREPPTTPAPRVPLYQLMSVDEELFAVNSSQANVTPEDRLYWQSGTPAEGASKAASRAGKKRVAAYSPPPTDSPAGKRQETSFDLQNLGNTLKTPLIDPATQLWKKYSAGGDPAARLFDAALNRSPSGFRRALVVPEGHSQNRLKRRKTTAFEEIADSDVLGGETSSSSIPLDGVSRKKRVNRLMNQLKNVGKSETKPPIPELSSPLAKSRWRDMPSSPVHARPEENKVATELDKTEEVGKFISSESEDYGDFDDNDVDMDFFEQVDKAVERSQSGPSNSRPAHAGANMPSSPPNRFDDDDGDMFDDDGDDSFYSTAFDALMSPFDIPSKINQAGPRGATNAKNGSSVVVRLPKIT